jgi:ABC-2 type transport system permease protein
MIGGPIVYILLFGGVYLAGRVRQAPIMLVDQDHSAMSRSLTQMIKASDSLSIQSESQNVEDFDNENRTGRLWACIVIPAHFERDIENGKQTQTLVLVDGSNVLNGNVIIKACRTIMATFRAGIRSKTLEAHGAPSRLALGEALPIQAEMRPIFNPSYNYATFMLLGLACIALQQCSMMAATVSLGMEDPKKRTPLEALVTMIGKVIAHFLVMAPVSVLTLWLPFGAFGSSFHGDWALLWMVAATATLVNILCGFGFAGTIRNPLLTIQILLCGSVPIFLITGYTWPLISEPPLFVAIAQFVPLTHYWQTLRCVALMSSSASTIMPHLQIIAAWLFPAFLWAWLGFYRWGKAG